MGEVVSVDVLESCLSVLKPGRSETVEAMRPLKALFAQSLSVPGWTTMFDFRSRTPPLFTSAILTSVFAGRFKVIVADVPLNPLKVRALSVGSEARPIEMVKGGSDCPMSQVMTVGAHCAKLPMDVILKPLATGKNSARRERMDRNPRRPDALAPTPGAAMNFVAFVGLASAPGLGCLLISTLVSPASWEWTATNVRPSGAPRCPTT